jgi:hypothetical protein
MLDTLIQTSDEIHIKPTDFPGLQLTKPVILSLKGTGPMSVDGQQVCIKDDVDKFKKIGVVYNSNNFQAGFGTITLDSGTLTYASNAVGNDKKKLVLKGQSFVAKFTVDLPAIDPASGSPHPVKEVPNPNASFLLKASFMHIQMA